MLLQSGRSVSASASVIQCRSPVLCLLTLVFVPVTQRASQQFRARLLNATLDHVQHQYGPFKNKPATRKQAADTLNKLLSDLQQQRQQHEDLQQQSNVSGDGASASDGDAVGVADQRPVGHRQGAHIGHGHPAHGVHVHHDGPHAAHRCGGSECPHHPAHGAPAADAADATAAWHGVPGQQPGVQSGARRPPRLPKEAHAKSHGPAEHAKATKVFDKPPRFPSWDDATPEGACPVCAQLPPEPGTGGARRDHCRPECHTRVLRSMARYKCGVDTWLYDVLAAVDPGVRIVLTLYVLSCAASTLLGNNCHTYTPRTN